MKFFEREVRKSGRCICRIAGLKLFSVKLPSVSRIRKTGKPVVVIRIPSEEVGLFCHFNYSLAWMRWAEERGYRSYVDMRTPLNVFNHGKPIDYNPWDVYFRQEVDAAGIADAKKVLTTTFCRNPPKFPGVLEELDQGNPEFVRWREFTQRHIAYSDAMAKLVDEREAALFKGEKVLGCLVRGTDYARMKPKGHPVQPTAEQVIADAKQVCVERGIKKVFLATEDKTIREKFLQAFGDDLLSGQTDLPDYKGGFLVKSGALGDSANTLRISTQYFVSIALLARCSCMLAGCASGTVSAALLSKGFDLMRIYNLGYYG